MDLDAPVGFLALVVIVAAVARRGDRRGVQTYEPPPSLDDAAHAYAVEQAQATDHGYDGCETCRALAVVRANAYKAGAQSRR